jgi:hypothetical protein
VDKSLQICVEVMMRTKIGIISLDKRVQLHKLKKEEKSRRL